MRSFGHPHCAEVLEMFRVLYSRQGFSPPWIGYFVMREGKIAGACGFKNVPVNGKVEIAYWTFREYEHQGVATEVCNELVWLARRTDPSVVVTARTCSLSNTSSRVLRKNGFVHTDVIYDDECQDIFEWTYQPVTIIDHEAKAKPHHAWS
jgi:RimJ/RimL family protein N-acetyltransferase